MKVNIKTKIAEKFDFGMFSFSALVGFICIASLVLSPDASVAPFALAGLVSFPIGITMEKGFSGFLLNGILGQFIGMLVTLLPFLGSAGAMSFFILYLEIVAVTIFLRASGSAVYRSIKAASNRIKHINAN